MSETPNLSLPLVQPAQAQKHVTVNEALARLDGLARLVLVSVGETVPPVGAAEGDAYGVPVGAVNDWAGQAGSVAVRVNGGWVFVPARRGWRAMVLDRGEAALFDGTAWRFGALTLSPGGSSMAMRVLEADVTLTPGANVTASLAFPARAIAFGVTGRVLSAITGTAASWALGVAGELGRFGSGLGLSVNSWVNGPGAPQVTWEPTPLVLSAEGGDFAGGTVRLALHFAELVLPDPV
jgi:hypothetical protein